MSAQRASRRSFLGSIIVALATLGPIGRKLPAPGTWGSLSGLLYFTVFFQRLSWLENIAISLLGAIAAALVCGQAEREMGRKDPGEVVLDEFVALPLCFLGWPYLAQHWPVWAVLVGGFAFFRLFDILKPLGIRRLQRVPGGWGVVVDDTAAALAACAALHVAVRLFAVR